ncbi:MAG: hypothetical protein HDT28_00565 [Clostridiales bacterium]|nr:hypothetical protein [Clostridiales bacterium]
MNTNWHLPDNLDIQALFADCGIDLNDPAIFPKERTPEYIEWQERERQRQEKARAWRKANREHLNEWMRNYRVKRVDYCRALARASYWCNRDKKLQYFRNRWQNDPEYRKAHAEYCQKQRSENHEAYNEKQRDYYARTREKRCARARELYYINHDDRIAKQRARREKNRDKINARMREWTALNRDLLNAKARERDHKRRQSQEYLDDYRAKKRAYYAKNKERCVEYQRAWRARKKAEKTVATSQQSEKLNLNSNSKLTENKDI